MSVNNRTGCNYWGIGSVLHTFVSAQRQMTLLVRHKILVSGRAGAHINLTGPSSRLHNYIK